MKKSYSSEFTAGIFAIIALVIVIILSLKVNDKGLIGNSSNEYSAYFDTVSGLVARTPIEVAGIMVGYVDRIELDGQRAKVTVQISKSMKLFKDAALEIQDRGVLGDKFIALTPGSAELPQLSDGDLIENAGSASGFEDLTAAVGDTSALVKDLLSSDNPKGAIGTTITNLRDSTDKLHQLINKNDAKINSILANFESFSSNLDGVLVENKKTLKDSLLAFQDMAKALEKQLGENGNITQTTENLKEAAEGVNNILAKIEAGEGTVGKLVSDETTINKIHETIDGVNSTIGAFQRIQLGFRYRGEFLQSSSEIQNLIGLTISPSPDKYLLVELVDGPFGDVTNTETTVTGNGGNVLSSTNTRRVEDKLTFNLQLAKRFWDLTFRAGMMRNEGGLGLDYSFLRDKFVISAEAFNFSRENDNFQFRTYASLFLFKNFMLTGGVDDLFSDVGQENYFIGAGLHLQDKDFKGLLPALGTF